MVPGVGDGKAGEHSHAQAAEAGVRKELVLMKAIALLGELPFFLWLLVKDVNMERWNALTATTSSTRARQEEAREVIAR